MGVVVVLVMSFSGFGTFSLNFYWHYYWLLMLLLLVCLCSILISIAIHCFYSEMGSLINLLINKPISITHPTTLYSCLVLLSFHKNVKFTHKNNNIFQWTEAKKEKVHLVAIVSLSLEQILACDGFLITDLLRC